MPAAAARTGTCAPPPAAFLEHRAGRAGSAGCLPTASKCRCMPRWRNNCAKATSRCWATCTCAAATTRGSHTDGASARGRRAWGRLISTDIDASQRGTDERAAARGASTGFQAGTDLWADTCWNVGVYVGQLEGNIRVNGFARGIKGTGRAAPTTCAAATWAPTPPGRATRAGTPTPCCRPASTATACSRRDLRQLRQGQEPAGLHRGGQGLQHRPGLDRGTPVAAGSPAPAHGRHGHHRRRGDTGPAYGLIVRAGVRIKGEIATGAGTLQPYGRINVFHASGGTDVTQLPELRRRHGHPQRNGLDQHRSGRWRDARSRRARLALRGAGQAVGLGRRGALEELDQRVAGCAGAR